MTIENSYSDSSLQDLSSGSTSHGLLLFRIPDYDAPLGDAFHAIQRALSLVHRLTIVVSIVPPSLASSHTTTPSTEEAVTTKPSATEARQGAYLNHNSTPSSEDSSDGHNNNLKASQRRQDHIDPNRASPSPSPSSFHSVQRLLSALYVSFTKQAMALQRPLAELDIVFRESCGYPIGVGTDDQIPFDVFLGMPDGKGNLNNYQATHNNKQRGRRGGRKGTPTPFLMVLIIIACWVSTVRKMRHFDMHGLTMAVFFLPSTCSAYSYQGLGGLEQSPHQSQPKVTPDFHTRPHTRNYGSHSSYGGDRFGFAFYRRTGESVWRCGSRGYIRPSACWA